ncbi:MAG: 30S ribosomal protein S3 [Candidatus Sungbacteria bacterium]|nr:30S ribosomal protein S3 [Candidatus Sungbacteria bacterium]
MTHRVHPYIFRIGHTTNWKSRWFRAHKFSEYLREDAILRELLEKKLRKNHIEAIEIERAPNVVRIFVRTARPGMIIGRGGEGSEKLKNEITAYLAKIRKRFNSPVVQKEDLKLTIEEVRAPETHALIAGQMIADEIEKRIPFRRVLKQAVERIFGSKGVEGVKIMIKGRLDGNEIARTEWLKRGRIPLQTIRANIDFAHRTAYTTYGTIGIKVWIYKGDIFDKNLDLRTKNLDKHLELRTKNLEN